MAPRDIDELEEWLSRPDPALVDMFRRLSGDIAVLGVGGKMGPTLARMARRAADEADEVDSGSTPIRADSRSESQAGARSRRRIFGVSRFSNESSQPAESGGPASDARSSSGMRERLESLGVETIACDLLDSESVDDLPEAPLLISMSGFKFGAAAAPALSWAINCLVPANVCRRYASSRIVAFSTGNVYGLVNIDRGGSRETDDLLPDGDYAMAALGRERMYEYFAERGVATAILRLNYAVEPRYGVLVDIGQAVLDERPIDLTTGYVNVIWQRDANAMALRALEHAASPACVLNVAGPERLRVRDIAERFGERFGKPARFTGSESTSALLSEGRLGHERLGAPTMLGDQLIELTADWLQLGGATLGKPTKFQVRDGKF